MKMMASASMACFTGLWWFSNACRAALCEKICFAAKPRISEFIPRTNIPTHEVNDKWNHHRYDLAANMELWQFQPLVLMNNFNSLLPPLLLRFFFAGSSNSLDAGSSDGIILRAFRRPISLPMTQKNNKHEYFSEESEESGIGDNILSSLLSPIWVSSSIASTRIGLEMETMKPAASLIRLRESVSKPGSIGKSIKTIESGIK